MCKNPGLANPSFKEETGPQYFTEQPSALKVASGPAALALSILDRLPCDAGNESRVRECGVANVAER
jgi:hypothetical protein